MPTYIMTEYLFKQLCQVRSFNEANGANYQEHILITMADHETLRECPQLRATIKAAPTGSAALAILTENGIAYTHKYSQR